MDIEDSSSVHRLNVKAEVTSLSWAAHVPEEPTKEDTIFEVRRRKVGDGGNTVIAYTVILSNKCGVMAR